MNQALKTLRAVQWALLGSIVIYAALGFMIKPLRSNVDPTVRYLFTTLGVAAVGIIFVVRRTLVFRVEASLAKDPDEPVSDVRHQ